MLSFGNEYYAISFLLWFYCFGFFNFFFKQPESEGLALFSGSFGGFLCFFFLFLYLYALSINCIPPDVDAEYFFSKSPGCYIFTTKKF